MQQCTRGPIVLWLLAFVLAVGAAFLPATAGAQSVTQTQYPGDLIDLSSFCVTHTQNTITPDSLDLPPGESAPPVPGAEQFDPTISEDGGPLLYDLIDSTDTLLSARLTFGPWSSADLYGNAGFVDVEDGSLMVVSCEGDLVIDSDPGDGKGSRLPQGIGAVIDSSRTSGVYIALDQMVGPAVVVQYGNGATSRSIIELMYDPGTKPVCTPSKCWDLNSIEIDPEGDGGCYGVRCWNW